MPAFSERRKFPRAENRFPVKYKDLKGAGGEFRGSFSKNIGEGGIRFRSDRFISLACRLVVEMNLPDINEPVRVISKIAWIKKLPVGDDYEIGNQFLEIRRKDKENVRNFVNQETQKPQT